MALISISQNVMINPEYVEVIEQFGEEIFLIIGGRQYKITNEFPQAIQEIQQYLSSKYKNNQFIAV